MLDDDTLFPVPAAPPADDITRDATVSFGGEYRYELSRSWVRGERLGRLVLWVMLNPSTADARTDDATIRRCIGYTRAWGYDGLLVGNLFAYRTPYPTELRAVEDPVGPMNDAALTGLAKRARLIVCAWGSDRTATPARVAEVLALFGQRPLHVLGVNRDGSPKHPVRLAKSLKPTKWTP